MLRRPTSDRPSRLFANRKANTILSIGLSEARRTHKTVACRARAASSLIVRERLLLLALVWSDILFWDAIHS